MGDSETLMAQTSTVDYNNASIAAASDASGSIAPATENMTGPVPAAGNTADSVAHGSNIDADNTYVTAVNTAQQETPAIMAYDANEKFSGLANSSLDSTQNAGYDSSLNGNAVSQAGNGETANITENGVTSADGIGSAALHQSLDGSGLSAEEERLWSIVTANSLDFNAWTALIEETERVSEANILKIRKVYDTFLAEFPLCYGYWKKYADHEAHLSSIDKVGEVYERAIQGVTYSVDMWLHYCVFAIGTYGDPDTIRSHLPQRLLKYKVVKLYERCLVACANYPEYWVRYVLCMEASGSMELAENALARATQVFVKRQPEIHLFAARFKEQHCNISGARAAYQLVHTGISPGLLEAIIKHANMERRLGNLEDAYTLYEQAIAIEKGKEQSQTLPLLFAQYSRFIFLVSGNVDKAREILVQGVESAQLSKPLLEAMIHLESIQPCPKQIEYLDSLVDKFIVPNPENAGVASFDEREELSSIFLEFLDLFGDAQSIKKVDYRHAKLFLRHKSPAESKKRHADDYLASDRTKLAKSLTSTSATSVMGAYPSMQNQWAAGYGAQPQAWPQASQTQGQQWNPAYAQQAAYGAYGSYGTSYTHPQIPTSTPQSAAYGTYPPTYPPQAFPQQSYAQPATAATLTPAQQPAAAPAAAAAYYTSYY